MFYWRDGKQHSYNSSGASISSGLHRANFITYSPSKMKIKVFSSSNKVAGEELI
jgi:hypothetical protein